MGYRISSLLGVSPNDSHSYFLYFIPSLNYEYAHLKWMNNYIFDNFNNLASDLGPKGVIIAPLKDKTDEFRRSYPSVEIFLEKSTGLSKHGCFFSQPQLHPTDNDDYLEKHLHSGEPMIIFSQVPLNSTRDGKGILINLSKITDEPTLGKILDAIIKTVSTDNFDGLLNLLPIFEKRNRKEDDAGDDEIENYLDMLELKPNIFGLGVNFNAVLTFVNKRLLKRKEIYNSPTAIMLDKIGVEESPDCS